MNSLFDAIVRVPPPFNMVVFIVMIVFGSWTICEIAKQLRIFACHRQELAFKRELVDQGVDTHEVARVVRATSIPAVDENAEETIGKPVFE